MYFCLNATCVMVVNLFLNDLHDETQTHNLEKLKNNVYTLSQNGLPNILYFLVAFWPHTFYEQTVYLDLFLFDVDTILDFLTCGIP